MDEMLLLVETIRASWEAMGRPARVLIGYSGGADSTALLCALHAFSLQNGGLPTLVAAHVHHGLRPNADEDARFAEQMCEKLSIPCRTAHLSLTCAAEEEARNQRYEALFDLCDQTGTDTIALAHHERDQAETVLMRLMRGSCEGLSGMEMFSGRRREKTQGVFRTYCLWRPFLSLSPDMLRSALQKSGISWREDESNQDERFTRNFVRLRLLPLMEERFPGAEKRIRESAEAIGTDNAFLFSLAQKWLADNASLNGPCLFCAGHALDEAPEALRRRIVREMWKKANASEALDYAQTCALTSLTPGEKLNLPKGWRALRTPGYLHFLPPRASPILLPRLEERFEPQEWLGDGFRDQAVNRACLRETVLRTRQPGDFICPLGMTGRKTLTDYLIDRKIDAPFRDFLPLLCAGSEVLWAVGVGVSRNAAVRPGMESMLLHYPGRLPMETDDQFQKSQKE